MRLAGMPVLRGGRVPDAPALPVRDPWPGDPGRGARLMKGEVEFAGARATLAPGGWGDTAGSVVLRAQTHSFTWLRDLRALGTDGARLRARQLVSDWMAAPQEAIGRRPDVMGARIAAWLGHYDFFAASADDAFRQKLMGRLVADARLLAAQLPAEELDARALTAIKGLVAAAVALPDHAAHLTRALRILPQELGRQVLPDGCHAERSPAAQLAALQDLIEMRALLQAAGGNPPAALAGAIERMAPALRVLRHGDGGLVLFNGAREDSAALIDLVLTQAGRGGRAPAGLAEGGFHRLQAGRSVLVVDAGVPPAPGIDRLAHAGTLSFELSVGRERLIVNCGASPAAAGAWRDASRATAAHSTLSVADTNSSELRPRGLGRRPEHVEVQRQEANGAHWLEASHDGYRKAFGVLHRRRLYMADSGEDVRGEDVLESVRGESALPGVRGENAPPGGRGETALPGGRGENALPGARGGNALPEARGGNALPGDAGQDYVLRFHLHPNVGATLQEDGTAVLLRLASGSWRLRAEGAQLTLEEGVYLGGAEPSRALQVVLTGKADGPQTVKWAITKA